MTRYSKQKGSDRLVYYIESRVYIDIKIAIYLICT